MRSTGDSDSQSQMRWARCQRRRIGKTASKHCWSCCIAWCWVRDKRVRFVEAATFPLRRARRHEGQMTQRQRETKNRCREQVCRPCSWPPALMQPREAAPAGALRSATWRCTATAACVPTCALIVSPTSTSTQPNNLSGNLQMLVEAATVFIRLAAVFTFQLSGGRLLLLRQSGAVAGPPFRL
jgi:hypothetical protein